MPKVSVIIPTYNRASMLKEAIQSVLDQTYTDYEIIVIDDGSTDSTREVVDGLKQRSGRVTYLYQENKGRSAARNHGINLATGNYIAFLDADDKFLPQKLYTQVHALDDKPEYGMTYSYSIAINERGRILREGGNPAKIRLSGWIYPELLFIKGTIITTPTVMVRASVLREIGGFDETMHTCEDLDLWRRIARRYKVFQIEEPLSVVRYRKNEETPLREYVQARSYYYQKAIAEDPDFLKPIRSKLFFEMYFNYGLAALLARDIIFGLQLLGRSVKTNAPMFPLEFLRCIYRFALSAPSRYLASRPTSTT